MQHGHDVILGCGTADFAQTLGTKKVRHFRGGWVVENAGHTLLLEQFGDNILHTFDLVHLHDVRPAEE